MGMMDKKPDDLTVKETLKIQGAILGGSMLLGALWVGGVYLAEKVSEARAARRFEKSLETLGTK